MSKPKKIETNQSDQPVIFHDHHVHSHFSLNDCVTKITELVKKSKEYNRKSVTLTDHGTLAGLYELHKECKKEKLKPILGVEAYYVDDITNEAANIPYNYAHIILIAKTEEGWRNIKNMQSEAWEKGYLKKPRVDLNLIKKYGKGIICTTACYRGLVGWNYLKGNDKYYGDEKVKDRKKRVYDRISIFKDLFGDDLYVELQMNDLEGQMLLNNFCLKVAEKFKIKTLATGDCHYLNKDDYKIHDIMICHSRKKVLTDEDNGIYPTRQLSLKDTNRMFYAYQAWHDEYLSEEQFWDSIKTSVEVSDKIEEFPIKPNMVCLPSWDNPRNDFIKIINAGWDFKLDDEKKNMQVYKDRLQYEIEVFDELKMHSYMLVCADIIRRAKIESIPVGPGRGSVCGSLVAYLMDITEIDPIRFDITFERFLVKTRLSLPDIDMDFGKEGRVQVKKIVKDLYGEQNFASIVTYGDWKPRSLIKDIGRVLGYKFDEVNNVTKNIDDKTKKLFDEEHPISDEVLEWLHNNKKIFNPAQKLEGINRVKGVHASGMILTPSKLEDWTPVAYMIERDSEDKKPVKISEWDMYALEDLNILKIDFLGLQTLDVIKMCLDLINKPRLKAEENGELHDECVIGDIWKTCLNDLENKQVYKEIAEGNVMGCFQLETSEGMLQLIKDIKPVCFHDLIMIISLYRTAVLETGMHTEYIKRRNGEEFEYIHDIIKPVLKSTLGILIFQEQLMEIAVVAGNFTRQESDNFRKATKLKDPEKFKPWKDQFIKGCLDNKLEEDEAEKLWDWCYKFAGYGFNISHATAYALITYATAWLKKFFPIEYMTAVMSYNSDDDKMMPRYIRECNRLGLKLVKPDINKSSKNFKISKDCSIIQPFKMIKSIGEKALDAIKSARKNGKFESLEDFYDNVNKRVVNVRVMVNLILAGAFNQLENSVEEAFDKFVEIRSEKTIRQFYCMTCKYRYPSNSDKKQGNECPNCGGEDIIFSNEKCKGKKFSEVYISNIVYGFSSGNNPLKKYIDKIEKHDAEPISMLEDHEDDDKVCVAALVKNIKTHIDKRGNEMAFIDLTDGETDTSLTIFSSDWGNGLNEEIRKNNCYIIEAYKNRGTNLLYKNFRKGPKSKIIRLGL